MSTSSNTAISKLSLSNKVICASQHDSQIKSCISHKMSVPAKITKPGISSQNKVLNDNNNNDNNNKENNKRIIDTDTIDFPNKTECRANSVYESKTAAQLQQ